MRIQQGDCRALMAELPEASVDAIVTDPPYDLTAGRKGGTGQASYNPKTPAGRARIGAGGFMGQKWDATGVAFDPDTWRQALRVLKPGGHLVAFGATRTSHRMVCAIEDAGFEIRDGLGWLYGTGFPKATDKAKIPDAWRGWNTALKPAMEPICLARKPMEGTLAENLAKWGAGAMFIDGCRIDHDEDSAAWVARYGNQPGYRQGAVPFGSIGKSTGGSPLGRWPANLLHDGSDEVLQVFPAEAGAAAPVYRGNGDKFRTTYGAFKSDVDERGSTFQGDSGSAARFFYCPKASIRDRGDANAHPTVKPTDLMRWLCRLVTPPGGTVLDPFLGSGSTLKAAELEGFDAIGMELDPGYIEIARGRIGSDAPLFAEVAA